MDADLFQGIVPFVAVADAGSFRAAATELGVTPAAVSKSIARLEDALGVRLFNRTTRRVAITVEGEAFLERCREAVEQLKSGRALMDAASHDARGPLRISASLVLRDFLSPRLTRFAARYPNVQLRLNFTDRYARMVDEGVDVAFRIGDLEDSSLRARQLFSTTWATVASPTYLEKHGRPASAEDLTQHACLVFSSADGVLAPWAMDVQGRTPRARATVDDGAALIELATAGLGIARVFRFLVEDRLRDGRLVEVLPEHATPGPAVWMLWLDGPATSVRVQTFVDFVAGSA